jgi:hypothetical protein
MDLGANRLSRNDDLIALARRNGAPEFLLDFMLRYPYYVPSTENFITTAFRQYLPDPVWEDKDREGANGN